VKLQSLRVVNNRVLRVTVGLTVGKGEEDTQNSILGSSVLATEPYYGNQITTKEGRAARWGEREINRLAVGNPRRKTYKI
jgi:hypothetical protein